MDLVLFGMQGCGKGTQSQKIASKFDYKIFETGAELRRLASEDSELGKKIKSIIESGNLVSTEVVMEIITDFIKNLPKGTKALFDGIPRSEEQMLEFNALMKNNGREFKGLVIEISKDEAMKRLTTRRICESCKTAYPAFYSEDACSACGGTLVTRKDDTADAIEVRLNTYLEKTVPVIEKYNADNMLISVNGEQQIENVESDIVKAIEQFS